ncbi:MAG: oxygen-independent coproporphyrinogen III oxidase [Steroidobacteraceae bacterium]
MSYATAVSFDADCMRRYDREGPRYTSYPTAQHFADGLAPNAYELAAAGSRGAQEGQPLSAYVHIPFCSSPCFYCGCNKIITHKLDRIDAYVEHLLAEISLRSRLFDRNRVVDQLHFGGGTPTFLPAAYLIEIMARLDRDFQLTNAEDRDYSIEIDPRSVDAGSLQLLASMGFNRISLGVQDFDEQVQRAVNRVQPEAMVAKIYESARRLEFRSINFDLIYGLPLQTPSSFGVTLDSVVAMRPDRLAVYGYAHMPRLFKAQRQIRGDELPNAVERLLLLQLAVSKLSEAGYEYIGMDHFALPGDSLAQAKHDGTLHRSFQGYTTHADRDLVSFGVSAIGHVGDLFVQNHKLLRAYEGAVASGALPTSRGRSMSRDDHIRKQVINAIMCQGIVDIAAIEARNTINFGEYFARESERLQVLQADGLVEVTGTNITLTPVGRLLMRTVAMAFDAYVNAAPSCAAQQPAAMSRVI